MPVVSMSKKEFDRLKKPQRRFKLGPAASGFGFFQAKSASQ